MERAPVDDGILQNLVDTRIEAPTAEYKRWMPLSDSGHRANIARHICALSNSGGGYLVFGFENDGTPSEPHPGELKSYDQDIINGIVERYLHPVVHCAVFSVKAASGLTYPVVRIPSHGAQPVCARRDGPNDAKGRPTGINNGVHYIRVAGPKSVPIDSPERWREVIHRCVLAERDGLLNSIGRLFDKPAAAPQPSALASWTGEVAKEWSEVARAEWPVDHTRNRAFFGFRLLTANARTPRGIALGALENAIRSASFGAANEIGGGSSPFEFSYGEDSKPTVAVFDDVEGYERRSPMTSRYAVGEAWRVSATGQGASIQPLSEDSPWITQGVEQRGSRKWAAGSRLSPRFQIMFVAEHLAFVRLLAQQFPDATSCELVVDYVGLAGRRVDDPAPGVYFSRSYTAAQDNRIVSTKIDLDLIAAGLDDIVAALVGPVFRLFDGWQVEPDYVRSILENPR